MARPALRRGEHTAATYEVREPDGRWRAVAQMPTGYKPPRGSTWRARASYRAPARTQRVSAQGRTKGLAEQALLAKIEGLRKTDGHGGTADTLGDRIDAHIKDVLAGRVPRIRAQRSRTAYASMARVWCLPGGKGDSQTAGIRIDELTPGDLNRETVRISEAGGRSQLRHIRAIWRAAVQRAVDDGVINSNPVRDMAPLPQTDRDKPRTYKNKSPRGRNDVLTDEEMSHLLEVAYRDPKRRKSGLADLVALVAAIGLRIGEANSVRWGDLDLDGSPPTLSVTGKIVRVPGEGLKWEGFAKTAASTRTIPLPDQTAAMLKRRRAAMKKLGDEATEAEQVYVFPSTTRTMHDPDNRISRIRKLLDDVGLPTATNHTIRRTVENRLLRAGTHPLDIERIMGHNSATAMAAYWDRQSVPVRALPGLASARYLDGSGRQKLDRNSRNEQESTGTDGTDEGSSSQVTG